MLKIADKIITELWKIKDDMSKEAGKDMKAFFRRLNEEARLGGEVLVKHSCSTQMKVAEEVAEYNAGKNGRKS
ncbi:MAG: hypothetical protein KAU94_08805 [Verrucomicrobia bacterium]|nr:hypothetical protein [Verrucomicrobiota bacterium]